jgi:hypothetical protein
MYFGGGILGTILIIALIVYFGRRVWLASRPVARPKAIDVGC